MDNTKELLLDAPDNQSKKINFSRFYPKMYWLFFRKPKYYWIIFTSLIPGTLPILSHYFMGRSIDSLQTDNPYPAILKNALYFLSISIFSSVCNFLNYHFWIIIGSIIGKKVKSMIFKSYMLCDMEFFDKKSIGDLMVMISDDASSIEAAFMNQKVNQLRCLGQIIMSVLTVVLINYRLIPYPFLLIIGVLYIERVFRKVSQIHNHHKSESFSKMLTITQEILSNIKIVSSFNRQKHDHDRFFKYSFETAHHYAKSSLYSDEGHAISDLHCRVILAAMFSIGGYYVVKGYLTVGEMLSVSRALFIFSIAIRNFLGFFITETRAFDSFNRVLPIIENSLNSNDDDGIIINDFHGKIEFDNVWFKYPSRDEFVLKGVSFTINPGEITAFVGHSGSGKSTIIQLLLRFYDISQGSILLDGINIKLLNTRWLHRVIGVIQQNPALFSQSVEDNIRYSNPNASDSEIINVAKLSHAHKFISQLPDGYKENIGERGSKLSGGQQQRVAISRAILCNPTILIADEATSALDAESEKEVQLALDEIMKGRTSVLIAHRFGTIRSANIIHVFEQGRLVQIGTHHQLISDENGCYYHLVKDQL